jgi:hypothetical protein
MGLIVDTFPILSSYFLPCYPLCFLVNPTSLFSAFAQIIVHLHLKSITPLQCQSLSGPLVLSQFSLVYA